MLSETPLADGARWLNADALPAVFQPLTVIAVLLVALVMLQGRMPLRRGAFTILGCFIMIGGAAIANALLALRSASPEPPNSTIVLDQRPIPKPKEITNNSDPYAGASLTR